MDGTTGRLKWGGDAALRGDSRSLPRKVKLVDLFSGPVALDESGQADIPLDLPDFNGTLRLMAVAFTDDRYGNAEAEMVVAAPIVAELSTPRFITPGDQAAVARDLTNLSGATQQLRVALRALDPLAVADGVRQVTLKDRQRATLRFVATATGSYGLGRLRLQIDGQGGARPVHIVRESVLQVQPAHAAENRVQRLRLAPGESFAPGDASISGYYTDSITASLSLSNRPPINVTRLVQRLLSYPYGCTEQTISAAVPWVLSDDAQARRYSLPQRTQQERAGQVANALARLAGMRNASGAYSLWGDGSSQDIWLTAYAAGFMQDARDHGFAIPDDALTRSQAWLLQQLQQSGGRFGTWREQLRRNLNSGRIDRDDMATLRNDHRRFASFAAAALTLARDRQAPLSTVRQLYDRYQERALSPLPLLQLAAAFQL